jgi:membrane dipeptidase
LLCHGIWFYIGYLKAKYAEDTGILKLLKTMADPIEVHNSSIVIDAHADTPQRFLDDHWNFTDPLNGGLLNYDSARQGNLSAQFFAIWVDPTQHPVNTFVHRTLSLIDATLEQVRLHPGKLQLCLSADDILSARQQGRFAVLLGIEGGHSIANDLGLLRTYHRLGARYMTLTWSNTNSWADSSGDIDDPTIHHHNGLTAFGRQVIAEMNRLGMIVDVSHVSDKAFWDVLAVTHAPLIASHSAARALTHSHRNLTDQMLQAVADNNGVVMVNFFPAFIDEDWRNAWNAQRHERSIAHTALASTYKAKGLPVPFSVSDKIDREFAAKIGRPPLRSLVDHFDHIIKTAGIDHVGIGTDFDGIPVLPEGIDSAADLPRLTVELMARGYSAQDMRKLLGENMLRVLREVQSAADR